MSTLSGLAPIFAVKEISKTVDFYHHVLGFKVAMTTSDPMPYAIVERDGVSIHFTIDDVRRGKGALYAMTDDVDALYEVAKKEGANVVEPPDDRAYGMRDMYVRDPDGNLLGFGQPLKHG